MIKVYQIINLETKKVERQIESTGNIMGDLLILSTYMVQQSKFEIKEIWEERRATYVC